MTAHASAADAPHEESAIAALLQDRDEVPAAMNADALGELAAQAAHRHLESELAHELHGAAVHTAGPRVDAGAGVTLDEDRAHAVLGEKQRGGESDDASTDDENRNAFIC